eukprot:11218961-Lingulodinium_polyedra.AAC.1
MGARARSRRRPVGRKANERRRCIVADVASLRALCELFSCLFVGGGRCRPACLADVPVPPGWVKFGA